METRILETYLDNSLLELNGQDTWFEYITAAADLHAAHIAANPSELSGTVYFAIDPCDRMGDAAHAAALVSLKSAWRTYSSVSMGSLTSILKAIALDALIENAERDPQIKLTITLLLASVLPYVDLGPEAEVLQPILDQLIEDVERVAEAKWSMPTAIQLPDMPEIETPPLTARVTGIKFDTTELQAGLERASGPSNANGDKLTGNPQFSNTGQPWVYAFAPLAAEAVGEAIQKVAGSRSLSVKSEGLAMAVGDLVEQYVSTVAKQLTTASLGVEVRSRLLWWKEAKVSPTARIEYRSLPPLVAPVIMAFDFQSMLPALAPISVVAFLRESVRSLGMQDEEATLLEYLMELSNSDVIARYRTQEKVQRVGIQAFTDLVESGLADADSIRNATLFGPDEKLSTIDMAALVFTELQAKKAAAAINAKTIVEEEEPIQEAQEQEAEQVEAAE